MKNWFECKVTFDKVQEDGLIKKVTETYLVDALSFSEAETRICEEIQPFASGVFSVAKVAKKRITELIYNDNGDRWYQSKVNLIVLDEQKGTEKTISLCYMIQADNINQALKCLNDYMQDCLSDWETISITETTILDVYKYKP